MSRFTLADHLN